MFFLSLLACTGSDDDSTAPVEREGCFQGPTVTITSPESSSELPVGVAVTLSMEASSEVDDVSVLRLLWNVYKDGAADDENLGTLPIESWTPTAEDEGIWTIRAQVEDSCIAELAMEPVQDSVRVQVVP